MSRKIVLPRLTASGYRWCDVLGFVPAGSSSLQQLKQVTCESCRFARQSICSVVSLHCGGMSRSWALEFSEKVDVDHRQIPLWASQSIFQWLFEASSLNLWGWWHVWSVTSWGNPAAEGMGDCFHLHCQNGGWDRIGCTVFMDGSPPWHDREAPPKLVFADWGISLYTMRSYGLLFSWMRSLISDSVLPAGHFTLSPATPCSVCATGRLGLPTLRVMRRWHLVICGVTYDNYFVFRTFVPLCFLLFGLLVFQSHFKGKVQGF